MPAISSQRDTVFVSTAKIRLQIDGFPDFYAILGLQRDAGNAQIEEAVVSRAADLLASSFSRGGQSDFLRLLNRHMIDFRPVLLDKVARLSYDEQLRRHEAGESRAVSFETWKNRHLHREAILSRASRSLKARFKSAFWDAEYF